MKAAVVHSFDAPPRYGTFTDPVAGENEVLVNVRAVGLHRVIKSIANGSHYLSTGELPFIPGVDGVGDLEDGSRVYFGMVRGPFGTFAERCVTARAMCLPIPEGLDAATVAAMINPGMSSWGALTGRANFVAGESVLILGATGTSGRLAVQIAKRLGARRIVAAGRNAEALEELRAQGADAVISLKQDREALVSAFRNEWADRQDRHCSRLCLGSSGGSRAGGGLAERIAERSVAHSILADRVHGKSYDIATGGDLAQLGPGASWQRLRQRVAQEDI